MSAEPTNSRQSEGAREAPASDGSSAVVSLPTCRPTTGRLIWYCYGGSVPTENHSWVLHDVTCRTWVLRHFGRWTMAIVPLFLLYLAVMPTPIGTRLYTGIAFSLAIYVMALVFILIDTDRRAVRAGYKYSEPQAIRTASSVERQRTASYQRRGTHRRPTGILILPVGRDRPLMR